jgi:hypothetical protein
MRGRAGPAGGYLFASEIRRLFDFRPAGQRKVELLKKIGDADDVDATDGGVEDVSRSAQPHVDLGREQRGDSQRAVGHDDILQIQPVLLEDTLLLGDPHRGDAVARHGSGKVSLYGSCIGEERRKKDHTNSDQHSP